MNTCKTCGTSTKNKVYCSENCQYLGYKTQKVTRLSGECLLCNKTFEYKQSQVKHKGHSKYCSRLCKDTHQKELYTGSGNPVFGTTHTLQRKATSSKRMKKFWKDPELKQKYEQGFSKVRETSEYPLGWRPEDIRKRLQTYLLRYGANHNWIGAYKQRKCDITYFEEHGEWSIDYCRYVLKRLSKRTKIELLMENILLKYSVKHIPQYDLGGKSYDYYLPELDILIECDGDWHHGFIIKEEPTKTQINTIKNDEIKNIIAAKNGKILLRFWGHEINSKTFEKDFISLLNINND